MHSLNSIEPLKWGLISWNLIRRCLYCHKLLIWEIQTYSWRNVATDDVLPRFSRQPMGKKAEGISPFTPPPSSSARTDQMRGCKLKCFPPLDPCVHHISSNRTKSHLIFLFFQLFSVFLSYHFIQRRDKKSYKDATNPSYVIQQRPSSVPALLLVGCVAAEGCDWLSWLFV